MGGPERLLGGSENRRNKGHFNLTVPSPGTTLVLKEMAKGRRGTRKKERGAAGLEQARKQSAGTTPNDEAASSAEASDNAAIVYKNAMTVTEAEAALAAAQANLDALRAATARGIGVVGTKAAHAAARAAKPAPTGASSCGLPPTWSEADFKKKCNWDKAQETSLADLLEEWYDDKGVAPISNSEWEEFADKYNEDRMAELEAADPCEWPKLRSKFRSAGALSKKVKAIIKSRQANRTGVSHVPDRIAKISRIMKASAESAHVITVDKLYNNRETGANSDTYGEGLSGDDGAITTPSPLDSYSDFDCFGDDACIDDHEVDQTAKRNAKKQALKNTAMKKKNSKRRLHVSPSSASPKRRRSELMSSGAEGSSTEKTDLLSTFLTNFSPQPRKGRERPTDMMQPLMQMMMLKLLKDMVKN